MYQNNVISIYMSFTIFVYLNKSRKYFTQTKTSPFAGEELHNFIPISSVRTAIDQVGGFKYGATHGVTVLPPILVASKRQTKGVLPLANFFEGVNENH
jgi:hypothetical protein